MEVFFKYIYGKISEVLFCDTLDWFHRCIHGHQMSAAIHWWNDSSFCYFICSAWLVYLTLTIRHHTTFYLPCFDKSLHCLAISQKVLDDLLWEVFLLLISVICWESHHNRVYAHINLRQVHRVHFRLAMTVKKSTEPPITLLPNQQSPQGKNKHLA